MAFEDCLYKRGFFLTDTNIENPMVGWVKANIGIRKTFYLFYDPLNEFSYFSNGNKWVALLGRFVDTLNWITNIHEIGEKLFDDYKKSKERFYNYIDYFNGRFVIFYGNKSCSYVMNDATGMRSVYYSLDNCAIASHYGLIYDVFNNEEEPYYAIYNSIKAQKPWTLPGDMTPYKNVRLLIPNHEFLIEQRKIQRFYPRKNHGEYSPDEICDSIAENIQKQVELLSKKNKLMFSITRGMDSRVSMAASKTVRDKCIYFTYANSNFMGDKQDTSNNAIGPNHLKDEKNRVADLKYTRTLCELYGLRFVALDLNHPIDQELINVLNKNHYHSHIVSSVESYLKYLPKGLHIRSNLIEIVRDLNFLYTYNSDISNIDNIIRWMQYGPFRSAQVIEYIVDFYKRNQMDEIYNYELLHMFYWEHRMAAWVNASVIVESDVAFDTYMLFNCRKLLEYGFCLPKFYRDLDYIPKLVIRKLWPELLFTLKNCDDTLLDYYEIEDEGYYRVKDNLFVQSGNSTELVQPKVVFIPRVYGALFGFAECENRKGDWCEASLRIHTKVNSCYHMQLHVLPPRANKLPSGKVDFLIIFNGNIISRIDLSYLVNRINQYNIFFVTNVDKQNLVFRLECKENIDNSMLGCNGAIDIKSIILKEDAIPYSDKTYVINTANICTKRFFREYFNIQQ